MTLSIRRIALAGTLALALVAPSCSSGGSDTATATSAAKSGTFPVQLESAEGTVTIKAEPVHIVSLSPTATEMRSLFMERVLLSAPDRRMAG